MRNAEQNKVKRQEISHELHIQCVPKTNGTFIYRRNGDLSYHNQLIYPYLDVHVLSTGSARSRHAKENCKMEAEVDNAPNGMNTNIREMNLCLNCCDFRYNSSYWYCMLCKHSSQTVWFPNNCL